MANDDEGYRQHPELSTSGIWNQDASGNQRFFHLNTNPISSPRPLLPGIGSPPFTFCSTSRGLVLFRDSMSHYYVGNPFIQSPIAFHSLPSIQRPHPPNTPAVLAIDLENPYDPVSHVICFIRRGPEGFYTFYTYSSNNGSWDYHEGISQRSRNMVLTTGVSCGRITYWLTRMRLLAVRYDVRDNAITFVRLTVSVPREVLWSHTTRLQLGRVGDQLGLAVVNGESSRVELHIQTGFEDWEPPRFLNVELREDANWDMMADLWYRGDILICREMPRLIRFDSFKMEVLLWVNGRVLVWESNTIDPGRRRLLLTRWNAGAHVANGMAYVNTCVHPKNFFLD